MHGKILIVDDVATNRIVFKVKMGAAAYSPILAATGQECLRIAREERPDLILLDLALPDISGIEVLRRLRQDPLTKNIPVIVVSASTNPDDRIEALEAGADDIFFKPYDDQLLMSRLRNLLRRSQEMSDLSPGGTEAFAGLAEPISEFVQPGLIAIVTDRADSALRLRRDLAPMMRDSFVIVGMTEALAPISAQRESADIYLIDLTSVPADRGLRLLSDLRSRTPTHHSGICVMLPTGATTTALTAFDLGANALVEDGMTSEEIALRLRMILRRKRHADHERERLQDDLRLAMVDPLTGLFNRRYAMAKLTTMAQHTKTKGRPFAVLMADLDRFKSVNDHFGHAAGDHVLIEIGRRLTSGLRNSDLLARVGGEEFLIALPDADLEGALAIATRLCVLVKEAPIALPGGQELTVTMSVGVAMSDVLASAWGTSTTEFVSKVMDCADQALMSSKTEGRNKVSIGRNAA